MTNTALVPACAYQGGKTRLAGQIADLLIAEAGGTDRRFADIGCGGGSVSIALVERGVKPTSITMIDKGPWGIVWNALGAGAFEFVTWAELVAEAPKDPREIHDWVAALSKRPATERAPYVFLMLQAASFGSKAIWIDDTGTRWQNTTFRSYWEPTETSNRRSPVNPMMPMPETLDRRVRALAHGMSGVRGLHASAEDASYLGVDVAYIDPPYTGLTAYGHEMDVMEVVERAMRQGVKSVLVSEARRLSGSSRVVELSDGKGRAKGGVSGERTSANPEFLSFFELSACLSDPCERLGRLEPAHQDHEAATMSAEHSILCPAYQSPLSRLFGQTGECDCGVEVGVTTAVAEPPVAPAAAAPVKMVYVEMPLPDLSNLAPQEDFKTEIAPPTEETLKEIKFCPTMDMVVVTPVPEPALETKDALLAAAKAGSVVADGLLVEPMPTVATPSAVKKPRAQRQKAAQPEAQLVQPTPGQVAAVRAATGLPPDDATRVSLTAPVTGTDAPAKPLYGGLQTMADAVSRDVDKRIVDSIVGPDARKLVMPQKGRLFAGIDPGLQGYVGVLDETGAVVEIMATPTIGKDKPVYDEDGVWRIARRLKELGVEEVLIERQQPINKINRSGKAVNITAKANFRKGYGYAMWLAFMRAAGVRFDTVAPITWKKAMGIAGGEPAEVKKRACDKAQGIFVGVDLRDIERKPKARVPSGDKAECLLLARYVMLTKTGGLNAVRDAEEADEADEPETDGEPEVQETEEPEVQETEEPETSETEAVEDGLAALEETSEEIESSAIPGATTAVEIEPSDDESEWLQKMSEIMKGGKTIPGAPGPGIKDAKPAEPAKAVQTKPVKAARPTKPAEVVQTKPKPVKARPVKSVAPKVEKKQKAPKAEKMTAAERALQRVLRGI